MLANPNNIHFEILFFEEKQNNSATMVTTNDMTMINMGFELEEIKFQNVSAEIDINSPYIFKATDMLFD